MTSAAAAALLDSAPREADVNLWKCLRSGSILQIHDPNMTQYPKITAHVVASIAPV